MAGSGLNASASFSRCVLKPLTWLGVPVPSRILSQVLSDGMGTEIWACLDGHV